MSVIYNLAIQCYVFLIFLASFFNPKAKKWIEGRKNWQTRLRDLLKDREQGLLWIHCASLGEFEQGRPVIEALKEKYPTRKILLTFFSPSGYEIRKNYPLADYVFYLPADTPANAREFMEIVQPVVAVFVKYEFWYNYLNNLSKKNIPVFLISAIFREDQLFFKSYGKWFRKGLKTYQCIFLQNEDSATLLDSIGVTSYSVGGDTRFDRVLAIAEGRQEISIVEAFKGDSSIFVAGSTWPEDEKLLADFIKGLQGDSSAWKWIIAPHEVDAGHIEHLMKLFPKSMRFSEATPERVQDVRFLIIDNIGMLSQLYAYGDIAYIGGGFGKGIHNVLEAAVFNIPVIFGPNYSKFREAADLVDRKGAFVVDSVEKIRQVLKRFPENTDQLRQAGQRAGAYVREKTGATTVIMSQLSSYID